MKFLQLFNKLASFMVAFLYIVAIIPEFFISVYKAASLTIKDFVVYYEQAVMYAIIVGFFIVCFIGFYL